MPGADAGLAAPARFTSAPDLPDGVVVEVPVVFDPSKAPGSTVMLRAVAQAGGARAETQGEVVVREPGWRMLMVPHFHYDPVWWNTQAAYTSGWDELVWAQDRRETFQHTGLALVEAHLERTRVDPLYKVVFAEVDYLKPFWDLYPDRRQELRDLIAAGRVEIVGGTYNEPNTNLTGAETAIRAAVYGIGFQRDVMGADPQSAWQLDVFGHDPQFPGIMAECRAHLLGLGAGPFHQWGPKAHAGSTAWMQFPSEFEWVAPNGRGLLTSYMPTHYSAGWELERATTVEGAMWRAYELLEDLAQVAATKVTLLPVGTDYTPPSRWVTEVAEAWARRYAWPRFEVGPAPGVLRRRAGRAGRPRAGAVAPDPGHEPDLHGQGRLVHRHQAGATPGRGGAGRRRDPGRPGRRPGGPVPRRELDKAWRQLVFNAHHDGITGSESDQVYLDLLGGWREAYELAAKVAERAGAHLVDAIGTGAGATGATGEDERPAVVVNTLGWDRSGLAVLDVPASPAGEDVEVADGAGRTVPVLSEPSPVPGSVRLSFRADDVPGVGYRTFWLRHLRGAAPASPGWTGMAGAEIANEHLEIAADPARGGGLSRVTDRSSGFELVPRGDVGNELLVYPEYANHPRFGEGPWHLLPSGPPGPLGIQGRHRPGRALGPRPKARRRGRPAGFRLPPGGHPVGRRPPGGAADRTARLGPAGPPPTPAVPHHPGRGHTGVGGGRRRRRPGFRPHRRGLVRATMDPGQPGGGMVRGEHDAGGGGSRSRAQLPPPRYRRGRARHPGRGRGRGLARRLVVALVQKGVTATCAEADRNRYGALHGDSNLPDFRVAVGGPDQNTFVADVLQAAGPAYRAALDQQLARQGWARLLVPAARSLREVWQPGADLRGPVDLPVIVVTGTDGASTEAAVDALVAEVVAGRVVVEQPAALIPHPERVPEWTAALLNRGTPGFAVDSSGALLVSLLRACTGWPSGVWIDPPRRFAPDGSAFELEHWSHVFENALFLGRGDWRQAGCVEEALAYNRPLRTSLTTAHGGALPSSARLLTVRPRAGQDRRGRAVLAVVKPAGNSLAAADPGPEPSTTTAGTTGGTPAGTEVTLRLYEAHGYPAEVEVESTFPIVGASRANLLEVPGETLPVTGAGAGGGGTGPLRLGLAASELATFRLGLGLIHGAPATGASATGAPATAVPATGTPATGAPATGAPATAVPATGTPATGEAAPGEDRAPRSPNPYSAGTGSITRARRPWGTNRWPSMSYPQAWC